MNDSQVPPFSVTIDRRGVSGDAHYREGQNTITFYWEFLSGEYVLYAWAAGGAEWDTNYPWAGGRKESIMQEVANEFLKGFDAKHGAVFDYPKNVIYFKKAP